MTPEQANELWKKASSFEELCQLGARYIEGEIPTQPWGEVFYEEMFPLRGTIAGYNRSGFLTTDSQPGEDSPESGSSQRAYVDGYARVDLALRLAALGLHTDLLVFVFPPGTLEGEGYNIPAQMDDFHATGGGGWCLRRDEEFFGEVLSADALASLAQTWKVQIIDPHWGRNTYLWKRVAEAVRGKGAGSRFSVTADEFLS